MKVLGLIPARSGSKAAANKNTRDLCGKPLISYAINASNHSVEIDECIVSTDCEKIAKIAVSSGGVVKFLRPAEYATDSSSDLDVIKHALCWYQEQEGKTFDAVAYLRPTTPFKSGQMIDSAIQKLKQNTSYTAVRTVTKSEGIHHPFWMYKVAGQPPQLESFIEHIDVEKDYFRRQLLPDCYRLNGVVDVLRAENVLSGYTVYGANIGSLVISDADEMDIDTETDLKLCEFFMKERKLSM